MSNHNSIVLKTRHSAIFDLGKIKKAICVIDAENVAKLLDHVNLAANPRESKKNKVTTSIIETLTISPEEMINRTKGLLISTQSCEILERGRFKLSFEDEKTDGVLDGGHNMLAIGTFLLERYYEESGDIPSEIQKIKCWDDFFQAWRKYSYLLESFLKNQTFLLPIEIIFPNKDFDIDFAELVFEISDARNNNSPLTTGTKADHRGYYDVLKSKIDPEISELISWKDNESGKRIKREDIVALSLIPLIALQKKNKLDKINAINPVTIYNSKSQCIDIYSNVFEQYKDEKGNLPKIIDSALSLMKDIPKFYDEVYKNFPYAYNEHSPGFGRISAVKKVKENAKKHLTKFYQNECDYKYPDGYIFPFVCSLHELIVINDTNVYWATDIFKLVGNSDRYEMLVGTIKDNAYDPQKVGKSSAAYKGCAMSMEMVKMNIDNESK